MTEKVVLAAVNVEEETLPPLQIVRLRVGKDEKRMDRVYDPIQRFIHRHRFIVQMVHADCPSRPIGSLFLAHCWLKGTEYITSLKLVYRSKRTGMRYVLWTSSLTKKQEVDGKSYSVFSEDETTLDRLLIESMIQKIDLQEEEEKKSIVSYFSCFTF